ncbi:Uncharacterised protein [Bordetella pertussis]|nr:Uncharacterised protein [Bordetella pertussis]CFN98948.1 Uncharacterised protein [Bordetella pertussis]CFP01377.1 Uncharacterised protein [Bordetella pertussis]CFP56945.1 Uncharacterised protein [Bordetella pertussis]CFT90315.1 Uncharacterised protein [Bordetella pertussis]
MASRRRQATQAAITADSANKPCAPANRWILVMAGQLAATQQTTALPSSTTPSHRVARPRN